MKKKKKTTCKKTPSQKKKKLITILALILVAILVFLIVWKATELSRYRKQVMDDIMAVVDIDDGYDTHCDLLYFYHLKDDIAENAPELYSDIHFQNFLAELTRKIFENGTHYGNKILLEFGQLACVETIIFSEFEKLETLSEALKFADSGFASLSWIKKDSAIFQNYIKTNGTQPVTTTPGQGYYANKKEEDSSYSHTVGISGSPLYNSGYHKYRGDFEEFHRYGKRLNSSYQEENYSDSTYYFRGKKIPFFPEVGEDLVLSGDYLFRFNEDGSLRDFVDLRWK